MQEYLAILKETQLFRGVEPAEIASMLTCLNAVPRTYRKGEFVFHQGQRLSEITVLVRGRLHVRRDDYWGNSNIISDVAVGEMFGEAYTTPDSGPLLNHVIAVEDSAVLFFDARRILLTCPAACPFHAKVVQNLFFAISDKNRQLMRKLGHMSNRTTRQKLMSYLSEESRRQGSAAFEIPFNRQQLADFLSVDRSAMSNELCKMRDEGLLRFEKNQFTLARRPELP